MASVAKRKRVHKGVESETWVVRYTDQGGKRRLKTFDKKKDADRFRTEVEVEIGNGIHTAVRETVRFREASQSYLRACEKRHKLGTLSGNTLTSYVKMIERELEPVVGNRLLTDLTTDYIQGIIDDIALEGRRETARSCAGHFKSILDYAKKCRWVKRNVLRDEPVKRPLRRRKPIRIPTRSDLVAIVEAAFSRRHAARASGYAARAVAVSLALFCGMRSGEIRGLQWSDIDFDRDLIRLRHSQSEVDGLKDPKSRAGVRTIPLPSIARRALLIALRYRQAALEVGEDETSSTKSRAIWRRVDDESYGDIGCKPDGYVLLTFRGKPLSGCALLWEYFREVQKDAGVIPAGGQHFTVHGLRHAMVSLMIQGGVPAMQISKLVGHSKVSTTLDIYGHLFPEDADARGHIRSIETRLLAIDATTARPQALTN